MVVTGTQTFAAEETNSAFLYGKLKEVVTNLDELCALQADASGAEASFAAGAFSPYGMSPSYPTNILLKWALDLGDSYYVSSTSLGPDGTLYIVQYDGTLWAIDTTAAGTNSHPDISVMMKWKQRRDIGGYGPVYPCPVIGTNGNVFVATFNDTRDDLFSCLSSTSNGSNLWTFTDPQNLDSYYAMQCEAALGLGDTVYIGHGTNAYAITNGSVKWFFPYPTLNTNFFTNNVVSGFQFSSPTLGADGLVYFNTDYGQLLALNVTNGSLVWFTPIPTDRPSTLPLASSPAIGGDGTIYYGAGAYVLAVNPTNGSLRWTFQAGSLTDNLYFSISTGTDGTVYVAANATLFAIDPTSGTQIWSTSVAGGAGGYRSGYPGGSMAVASDGEIYVESPHGYLYSIAPDGTTNWIYSIFTDVLNSATTPPLIGPDGTMYVVHFPYTTLYAFAGPAPIACSSWPAYRKNNRRTAAVLPSSLSGHLSAPALAGDGFHFTLTGLTNMPTCVCASAALADWTNISQVVLTNGVTNLVDSQAVGYPYRFYRASPQ